MQFTQFIMATLRGTFSYLPPPSECLAILVGCLEVGVFGLAGLASPIEFAKGYGLPIKSASAAQKLPGASASGSDNDAATSTEIEATQTALNRAIAARNLQHGAMILAFALYFKDRRALGVTVGAGLVTTLADFFLVHAHGLKEAQFGHIIGIFNCGLLGTALLWWGRNDPWY